ncbi:Roadblock/LC7 family protein [Deinococcus proteolyticus MRP]|uniref:Roadblock/LC7 family protein n=1 Tax=Deinococcus proteolyticus (strain ATCC 35074 / DSM 20540 / JCM 6276 / NBRC 101906 / NCIMB 13154 / VKM Ac-1939 / CCM 2703 / MRP) TaxID=693977 RepID=F0RM55_DEIPM|nr:MULTISPECIES: roadblock/LC7 domain-containing protein [Deinococcus]ADY25975.1 Roadblock/LC7 family protein [Deinococcus proteolyticus MRP]MCY1702096.1 roadblock/LC7 domain-containing protein [Deinococcus sp. SL84]
MLNELTQLVADVDGAWAAAIGGLDGLLVEGHSVTEVSLDLLVAEHAGLMRAVSDAYGMVGGGQPRELYIRGETLSVFVQPINAEFFVLLALDGRANLGQARLYARAAAGQLAGEL